MQGIVGNNPCHVLSARASCFALDNCSCIVLPSPFHGLVPSPSLDSNRDLPFVLNIITAENMNLTPFTPQMV
jgi:hypothetical protein